MWAHLFDKNRRITQDIGRMLGNENSYNHNDWKKVDVDTQKTVLNPDNESQQIL